MAASTSFNFVIPDGTMSINGNPVSWDDQVLTDAGTFIDFFSSHFADVTAIVAPIVDAAPAGIVPLTIGEGTSSGFIDGSTLVVVFDDPSQTTVSSVVLLFGGQATTGDTSALTLAEPFDDANQDITLSLAIGFSNQAGGQFSLVDVNGQRLTSSAADLDDGQQANGALYTVGGLGDDPANPPDPNSTSFDDDELYTLDPLLTDGATNISVFSQNPSNDDIIHLATFIIEGTAAIVGEGILLTPLTATNPINTDHTVTAVVQDDDGNPVVGRDVDFEVIAGPNVGLTGSDVTDASGEATFTWSSAAAGTDVVVARFVDSQGEVQTSNQAEKTWTDDGGDTEAPVCGEITIVPVDDTYEVVSSASDDTGIASVTFTTLTPNLDGFVDDGGEQGPFVQGDVYTTGDPDPTSVGLRARFTALSTASFFVTVADAAGNTAVCDPVLTELAGALPEMTALGAAYPNPASVAGVAAVTVPFRLAEAADVRVVVYDVLGREVAVLADGVMEPGSYEVSWPEARSLPSGSYVVRMTAGTHVQTQRLTLVR